MNTAGAFSIRDQWLTSDGSTLATAINDQFELLLILGVAMLLGAILVVSIVAANRSDRVEGRAQGMPMAGGVIAGVFGAVLAVVLFLGGLDVFVNAEVAPARARVISAVADTTGWRFVYGPDVTTDVLHVSNDEATRLDLSSEVGLSRFSVPALRVAETVWPDAASQAWFHATTPGEYPLHATGVSAAIVDSTSPRVVVHDGVSFDEWMASVSNVLDRYPPIEAGQILVQRNGCLVCHSTDGTPGTAPSFHGLLARTRDLLDGTTAVQADSVYVRQSILDPASQVVQGFQPVMPSFQGKLNDDEIAAIRMWIDTLDDAQQEEGR